MNRNTFFSRRRWKLSFKCKKYANDNNGVVSNPFKHTRIQVCVWTVSSPLYLMHLLETYCKWLRLKNLLVKHTEDCLFPNNGLHFLLPNIDARILREVNNVWLCEIKQTFYETKLIDVFPDANNLMFDKENLWKWSFWSC